MDQQQNSKQALGLRGLFRRHWLLVDDPRAGRGAWMIPLLGRLTLQLSKNIRCFSNTRRLPSSASSSDSAISERWPVSSACLTIPRWRRIWTANSAMCRLACARCFCFRTRFMDLQATLAGSFSFTWRRDGTLLVPLLSRGAPFEGLVPLRQPFVRRCQCSAARSRPPRTLRR
jgi:hypothetical protein